jgi:hypothetical protein
MMALLLIALKHHEVRENLRRAVQPWLQFRCVRRPALIAPRNTSFEVLADV